ncbi:hypothetical protein JCM11251_006962 [Rhodosporidiobolus azoricus]
MRLPTLLSLALPLKLVSALPAQHDAQQVLAPTFGFNSAQDTDGSEEAVGWLAGSGAGHLSEWSRQNKEVFLSDLRNNSANEWIIVMGNEAGDLDSLVSALALSYLYNHLEPPQKAVALLQTEQDALDLRPENVLSLHWARMSSAGSGHDDLLTIDELPIKPIDLGHRIKGIALVDHNVPRSDWNGAEIVAIIDHHEDRGLANGTANPRILERTGSCSSLVAKYLLENLPGAAEAYPLPKDVDNAEDDETVTTETEVFNHGPVPKELVELLLRTIAIDTSGLKKDSCHPIDKESAERLFPQSSWKQRKLKEVMGNLDDDLSASRKALDDLDLRSLLRRDWKGDSIKTRSKKYPHIALGFASAPVSLEEQIKRTPEKTVPEWFAIERAWTSEIQADVTISLSNFRHPKTGDKTRQIALVVAHGYGKRLHEGSANRLFHQLRDAIETAGDKEDGIKGMKKWKRPDGKDLLARRAVYEYQSDMASRKYWRPILEEVVRQWQG